MESDQMSGESTSAEDSDVSSHTETVDSNKSNFTCHKTMDRNDTSNVVIDNHDNTGQAWYNAAVFNRFWNHYQSIHAWFRKHDEYIGACQPDASRYREWCLTQSRYHEYMAHVMRMQCTPEHRHQRTGSSSGQCYFPYSDCDHAKFPFHYGNVTCSWGNAKHQKRKKRSSKKCKNQKKPHPVHVYSNTQGHRRCRSTGENIHMQVSNFDREHGDLDIGSVDREFEFEMEITDEMKDFFSQSEEHRRERDSKKLNDDKKTGQKCDNDVYVELSETLSFKSTATVLPPSERPGSRRIAEMKELYGAGAAMIHGMETAMQLSYDRHADRKRSKLWPALPINIKFS